MIVSIAIAIVLAAFAVHRLRANRYSFLAVSMLVGSMLLQISVCFLAAVELPSMLLALALAGTTGAATAMVERYDVTGVVAVGGALAGTQFLTPLGSLIVAVVLPPLLGVWHPRLGFSRTMGFGALLLFPAVLAAVLILCLPPGFRLPLHPAVDAPASGSWTVIAAAIVSAPVFIASIVRRGDGASVFIVPIVSFALVVALAAAAIMGALHDPREAAAALGPVTLFGAVSWRPGSRRTILAVATAMSSASLAWLILAVPMR